MAKKWIDMDYEADRIFDSFRNEVRMSVEDFSSVEEFDEHLNELFSNHKMLKRLGSTGQSEFRNVAIDWYKSNKESLELGKQFDKEQKAERVSVEYIEPTSYETDTGVGDGIPTVETPNEEVVSNIERIDSQIKSRTNISSRVGNFVGGIGNSVKNFSNSIVDRVKKIFR